jgi:serine protease Do
MEELMPRLRILLALITLALTQTAQAADVLLPTADLVERLLPTMVKIETRQVTMVPGTDGKPPTFVEKPNFGSGFIIGADGVIVTNWHVIAEAREITVVLHDDTRLEAEIIYRAPIDLAVIKVHLPTPLPVVTYGNSDTLRPGQTVIAIGNPLSVGVTVTKGIVSAINKGLGTSIWDDYIQTDASLNKGNSGGPLFNDRGELVGVNSILVTPGTTGGSVGLGFAIPVNDLLFVLERWKRYGRVRVGWLGAEIAAVTPDIAEAWGLLRPEGVLVVDAPPGTAAAQAGLLPGDVLLRIGESDAANIRTVYRAFGGAPIDSKLPVVVRRQNESFTVDITVVDAPASVTEPKADAPLPPLPAIVERRDLGLTLARATDALRKTFQIPSKRDGLVVTAVAADSVAARHGIVPGTLILVVQHYPVSTPEDFLTRLDEARKAGRERVFMVFAEKEGVRWDTYPLNPGQR